MTYTIVESACGHLYSTIWLPAVSFKALRAGNRRYQLCPICRRRTWATPAETAALNRDQIAAAEQIRDSYIP